MKQSQKVTPLQLMTHKLLQMPVTELSQAIKDEMERNPLLEEGTSDEEAEDLYSDTAEETADDENNDNIEPEVDMDEAFADSDDDYEYRMKQEYDPNEKERQSIITDEGTFLNQLLDQLNMRTLTEREHEIAAEIIGSIDEAGYLARDLTLIQNDLALRNNIEATDSEMQDALATVQSMEPAGVGARTLQECLSLQLHRKKESSLSKKVAIEIVDHYFKDFTQHRLDHIAEHLGVDTDVVDGAVEYIRTLNPKPGNTTAGTMATVPTITPDFIVLRNGDELSFTMPHSNDIRLHVSNYYTDMLKEMSNIHKPSAEDRETIQFLRSKADNASTFITALGHRRNSLATTMEAILKRQHDFFMTGDRQQLRPMRLKDIAEMTGQDISTISRVVMHKYVQTEFGTFSLKSTFSNALYDKDNDGMVSSEAIRDTLATILETEDKHKPLTDEQLVAILKGKGLNIARRTVAKYRDIMGVPGAKDRRQ